LSLQPNIGPNIPIILASDHKFWNCASLYYLDYKATHCLNGRSEKTEIKITDKQRKYVIKEGQIKENVKKGKR